MVVSTVPGLEGREILVVDDHDPTRQLLVNFLGGLGVDVDQASGGIEALNKMAARTFDLVLLDLRMDDLDGLEVLKRAKAQGLARNYTMMSAEGTVPSAVEAIRLGASDFLMKPFELDQMLGSVRRVVCGPELGNERDPRAVWRDEFAPDLIGEHESLLETFLVLDRISNTDCTVLVLGESGTGKELIARAIHNASGRSKKTMVPVNCGAIPETLIESELFGHTKGAFSGATHTREGRFAAADNSTLFLDEIGEMSLNVQVKLLRVLQEGEFVPVGETRPRIVDVRIIAATNKNLEKMAQTGTFREDLFYRLNLIPIYLPPLRERASDIPLLAEHFLTRFNRRRGREVEGFTAEALERMSKHPWPGNVRELENTIERMTLLHSGNGVLDIEDLPAKVRGDASPLPGRYDLGGHEHTSGSANGSAPGVPVAAEVESSGAFSRPVQLVPLPDSDTPVPLASDAMTMGVPSTTRGTMTMVDRQVVRPLPSGPTDYVLPPDGIDLRRAVEDFETNLIDQALARTGGNRNQASQLLSLNRTTLVEKLRKRKKREEARRQAQSAGD